jgi:hypothetical protein
MLVPSLADQSHRHAEEAVRLGPDDLVTVDESDVFDLRHITTMDSALEAQRGKRGVRNWSGGDQDLRLRVSTGMAEFEGGVEHGHPDHHRGADVGQRVANEVWRTSFRGSGT